MNHDAATETSPHVLIAVCTCRRPSMLQDCLDSIVAQEIPHGWRVSLVVIENDDVSRSRALVRAVAETAPFPISYLLETQRGIPFGRNRALDEATRLRCDWLIFIDDDEVAERDWLLNYAETLRRYRGADVIHGKVIYRFPKNDRWAYLLERNAANERRIEGKQVHSAATNNVLISSRIFSVEGMNMRFDGTFRFSGGSDTEFFNRARLSGAAIVYSAMPVVFETVPIERCSVQRLFQREARTTAAAVCIDARHYGWAAAIRKHIRRATTNLFQCFGYLIMCLCFALFHPEMARKQFLVSLLRFGRFYGRVLGLGGRTLSPYKTIDAVR